MQYDLAIAGAGPAGSVLAYLAAKAGLRVLLAEQSHFDQPRIGETAPPELKLLLEKLGLGYVLDATSREVPALVSVWGSSAPFERHHISSPYGGALHLDRRGFDGALARAANAAGADLRLASRVRLNAVCGGGHVVLFRDGGIAKARVAVVASGRRTAAAVLGGTRCFMDDQVAVSARFRSVSESRTIVEAIAGGWFYLATLPHDQTIAVFITRARAVPSDRATRREWWLRALARTRFIRAAVAGQPVPATLAVHDARGSFARTPAGKDWLAIGDARLAPDRCQVRGSCGPSKK